MGYTPLFLTHGPELFASLNVGSVFIVIASGIFYCQGLVENSPMKFTLLADIQPHESKTLLHVMYQIG